MDFQNLSAILCDFGMYSSINQLKNYLTDSRITQIKNSLEMFPCKHLLQVSIIASSIKTSLSVSRLSIVGFSTLFIKLDLKTETILRLNMSCS